MDLRHSYPKRDSKEGDIKTFSIVGDYDLVFLNIMLEFLKVLPLDIGEYRFAVIEGDRSYFIEAEIQPRSLDVQVSR